MGKLAKKSDIKETHKDYYVLKNGGIVDRKLFDTAIFLGEEIEKLKKIK